MEVKGDRRVNSNGAGTTLTDGPFVRVDKQFVNRFSVLRIVVFFLLVVVDWIGRLIHDVDGTFHPIFRIVLRFWFFIEEALFWLKKILRF